MFCYGRLFTTTILFAKISIIRMPTDWIKYYVNKGILPPSTFRELFISLLIIILVKLSNVVSIDGYICLEENRI